MFYSPQANARVQQNPGGGEKVCLAKEWNDDSPPPSGRRRGLQPPMGGDEEGTLAALKTLRNSHIDPKIAEHRGRIVKTTGDGALVEFASTVDAVRCAIDIQHGMPAPNADRPPDKKIEFRIGINVGDIIVEGDDIFGDGVNVAARLESICRPGGICVSDVVHQQVNGRVEAAFIDLGEQTLKNIARPVHAYAIALHEPRRIRFAGYSAGSRCRTNRRSRCCRSRT